jgi:hypothetical protein
MFNNRELGSVFIPERERERERDRQTERISQNVTED